MRINATPARIGFVLAAVAATSVAVVAGDSQVAQAAPSITESRRVYPTPGLIMNFSGTDPISGDSRAIVVAGLASQGTCDTSDNTYLGEGCANVQLALDSGKAGLLRLPNTTPVSDPGADPGVIATTQSGALITQATDPQALDSLVFHVTGAAADVQAALDTLQFVPCQMQVGTPDPAYDGTTDTWMYEARCGSRGGDPALEPVYLERESADGLLPDLSITAVSGDSTSASGSIVFKIEGTNAAPEMSVQMPTVQVAAGATTDIDDNVTVVDPDACKQGGNDFQFCGTGWAGADMAENDDAHLLVAWIAENDCGRFAFPSGAAFTSLGGGSNPTVDEVVQDWTGLDPNDLYEGPAVTVITAAVLATLSPEAAALDLTTQPATGNLTTVFAGIGPIAELRYALDSIDYEAPADDATCHLDIAVSDLGNNGAPLAYVGSPWGPETPFAGNTIDHDGDPGTPEVPGNDRPYEVPAALSATTSLTFNVVDGQPNVTISQILPGQLGDPAGPNKPSGFRISFNEPIEAASFNLADLSLSTSTAPGAAYVGGLVPVVAGLEYTVFVEATDDGTITLTFPGTVYAAGHDGDAGYANEPPVYDDNEIEWDQTGPTATIAVKAGQPDPVVAPSVVFTVEFDETVSSAPIGFDEDDIELGGTALPTTVAVSQPDLLDLKTYEVTVTGMSMAGTVTAQVKADAIVDTAVNPSTESLVATANWDDSVPDTTAPTVTINQGATQADPANASPVVFDVVFSELVTGFTASDVELTGPAAVGASVQITGAGPAYVASVTVVNSGVLTANIAAGAATDLSGNPSEAATWTDNTVTVDLSAPDVTPPTVTVEQGAAQADPATGATVVFDIEFSEPVIGFATGDVTIGGTAGATTATVAGSGASYTATVQTAGLTSGTVTASVAAGVATDAASNPNLASTSADNTVTYYVAADSASTGNGNVTLNVTNGGLTYFAVTEPPSVAPPASTDFPYGEWSFSAITAPGALVTFEFTLPAPVDTYYKLDSGSWAEFAWDGTTGAQVSGNTLTVTIADNGRGDADLTPGVVTDPGAPAVLSDDTDPSSTTSTTTTTTLPDDDTTTSSTTVPDDDDDDTTSTTSSTVPGGDGGSSTSTSIPGGGATTTTPGGGGGGIPTLPVTPGVPSIPTGGLPATGSSPAQLAAIAAMVLVAGVVLAAVRRRSPA
ncbi:MAG TPA: choice-of-anchor U domain-containing protein [Ilumatobacter sp.]|nr:choice-of-anchor U domain-containing protein [Ilumatobacter sp.]